MKALKRNILVGTLIVLMVIWNIAVSYGQNINKYDAKRDSTQVTLTEISVPDTCWVGQTITVSVAAKVEGNDSPSGGITLSFSQSVDIPSVTKDDRIGVSRKVYPVGSKVWNQQKKSVMTSIFKIAELWVEAWPEEQTEWFYFYVIPQEAGDLEISIRATVKDAETGEFVNAPAQGVLDQQGYPSLKRIVRVKELQLPQIWNEQTPPPGEILSKAFYDVNKNGIEDFILAVKGKYVDFENVQLAVYTGKNGSFIKSWSTLIEVESVLEKVEEIKIEFLDCNKDGQEEMVVELTSVYTVGASRGSIAQKVALYYSSGLPKRKIGEILLEDGGGPIPFPDFGRTIPLEVPHFSREVRYLDVDGDSDEDIVLDCYKDQYADDRYERKLLHRREAYLWQEGTYLFDKKFLNNQVEELLHQAKTAPDANLALQFLDTIQQEYYSIEPQADPSLQLEAYYTAAQRNFSLKQYKTVYKSLEKILSAETSSPQVFLLKTKASYEMGRLYEEQFHDDDAALSIYRDLLYREPKRHYREEEIRTRVERLEQRRKDAVYTPLSKENLGKIKPHSIKVVKEEVLKGLSEVGNAWWASDGEEVLIEDGNKILTLQFSSGVITAKGEGEKPRYFGDTKQICVLNDEGSIVRLEDNQVIVSRENIMGCRGGEDGVGDYLFSPDGRSIGFKTSARFWAGRMVADWLNIGRQGENGFEIIISVDPEATSGSCITLLGWRNDHELLFTVGLEEEPLHVLKFALFDTEEKVIRPVTLDQIGPGRYSSLISPDGSKLAYFDTTLWIQNSDGSYPSLLEAPEPYPPTVRWSPDGSKLMFWDEGQLVILTLAVLGDVP